MNIESRHVGYAGHREVAEVALLDDAVLERDSRTRQAHRQAHDRRALHLGATGLTFFDDDVINFFSPHATEKSAIFLLAIGKPRKRKAQ